MTTNDHKRRKKEKGNKSTTTFQYYNNDSNTANTEKINNFSSLVRVGEFCAGTHNNKRNNTIMGAFRVPDYFQQQGRKEEEEDKSTMTKNVFLSKLRIPKKRKTKVC